MHSYMPTYIKFSVKLLVWFQIQVKGQKFAAACLAKRAVRNVRFSTEI